MEDSMVEERREQAFVAMLEAVDEVVGCVKRHEGFAMHVIDARALSFVMRDRCVQELAPHVAYPVVSQGEGCARGRAKKGISSHAFGVTVHPVKTLQHIYYTVPHVICGPDVALPSEQLDPLRAL
eukprot:9469562-Pyramimonas_sp.AAC.1